MHAKPTVRGFTSLAVALLAAGGLAACSSSPSTHGTASVAYADSLQQLFASTLQSGFQSASGDQVTGRGAGSTTLASEILSGEITPGAFISVGKKAIEKLWPAKSSFLITLATDPLVVMYNPKSSYASQFAAIAHGTEPISDLFTLLATPGLRLGRTDPNADPQGVYFILMMELAQKTLGLTADPASTILGVSSSTPFGKTSQEVDADSLVSDLQAGEFDATSGYLTQAVQAKLPYIALPATLDFADPSDSTAYGTVSITLKDGTVDQGALVTLDITLVKPLAGAGAPSSGDLAADDAFLAYLLSSVGQTALKDGGYTVGAPVFDGATSSDTPASALPAVVASAFTAAGGTTGS
jgi:molybdate/tungstate transport system substrate-binding protein